MVVRPISQRSPTAGYRRRLLIQVIGMLAVALGVGLAALGFAYRSGLEKEGKWLTEIAQGQARLIEVMTEVAEETSAGASPEDALRIVLNQLRKAQEEHPGFGETGEFIMAELREDSIVFLLDQRHSQLSEPAPISVSSSLAEPMHRALGGISGTMTGIDYRGVKVLAAHEPVLIPGRILGIVAKVDYAAVRAPFLGALGRAALVALLLMALGVLLMLRVGEPVVAVLRANEMRLRRLFHDSGEAILISSGDGIILDANPAGADLLGRSLKDLIGRPALEFYSLEGGRDRFLEELRAHGRTEDFRQDLRRADGTVIHALLTATARVGKGGEIESIETLIRDTTAEIEAAAAVEAERNRAQLYLDTAQTIMVSLDPEGKIVLMNRKGCEVLGYSEGSLLGKDWFSNCLPERDREEVRRVFESIASGDLELFRTHENPVLSASGEERLIAWHNTLVFDEDRAVKELFSCGQDVTEERRAQEALRAERDKLKAIFEAMDDGIYIVSKDFEIEYVNPVLVADFGPYEGRKCYAYFHDREDVCPWCKNPEVFAGETVQWEWTSPGNGRIYDLIDTPLRNVDGSISKLEIFRDITERRQAEIEVLESRAQLRALTQRLEEIREEEKATLARELHDELGQALTGLRMDLSSLRGQFPEEASPFRARLGELADATEGLVEELRSICGRLRPPILDVLGLPEAIEWQVGEFQKRSRLEFDLELDIGGLILEKQTATVAFRLIQESVVNAMRHADATGVRISLFREEGALVGEIQDDGRGIRPEEIASPSSLGLAGMRERVRALDGDHLVQPRSGGGTRVRFRLPFREAPPRENGP